MGFCKKKFVGCIVTIVCLLNNSRYSEIISNLSGLCFSDKKQLLETKSGNLDNKPLETQYWQGRVKLGKAKHDNNLFSYFAATL